MSDIKKINKITENKGDSINTWKNFLSLIDIPTWPSIRTIECNQ